MKEKFKSKIILFWTKNVFFLLLKLLNLFEKTNFKSGFERNLLFTFFSVKDSVSITLNSSFFFSISFFILFKTNLILFSSLSIGGLKFFFEKYLLWFLLVVFELTLGIIR